MWSVECGVWSMEWRGLEWTSSSQSCTPTPAPRLAPLRVACCGRYRYRCLFPLPTLALTLATGIGETGQKANSFSATWHEQGAETKAGPKNTTKASQQPQQQKVQVSEHG